jgi:HSP20 family molecular chaperone IbpA
VNRNDVDPISTLAGLWRPLLAGIALGAVLFVLSGGADPLGTDLGLPTVASLPHPVEEPVRGALFVALLLGGSVLLDRLGGLFGAGRRGRRDAATAAFFDPGSVDGSMEALRDALRELPEAVFADLLESDDAYLLVLDLPGVSAESTDVRAERGRLRIEARREKDLPPEYRYVDEDRSLFLDAEIPLPPDASDAGAEATVDRGVLEVRLPKRESAPERTIPISDAT